MLIALPGRQNYCHRACGPTGLSQHCFSWRTRLSSRQCQCGTCQWRLSCNGRGVADKLYVDFKVRSLFYNNDLTAVDLVFNGDVGKEGVDMWSSRCCRMDVWCIRILKLFLLVEYRLLLLVHQWILLGTHVKAVVRKSFEMKLILCLPVL